MMYYATSQNPYGIDTYVCNVVPLSWIRPRTDVKASNAPRHETVEVEGSRGVAVTGQNTKHLGTAGTH